MINSAVLLVMLATEAMATMGMAKSDDAKKGHGNGDGIDNHAFATT